MLADSGAQEDMKPNTNDLQEYKPIVGRKVITASGEEIAVKGSGKMKWI
jgi:hypothetical protein